MKNRGKAWERSVSCPCRTDLKGKDFRHGFDRLQRKGPALDGSRNVAICLSRPFRYTPLCVAPGKTGNSLCILPHWKSWKGSGFVFLPARFSYSVKAAAAREQIPFFMLWLTPCFQRLERAGITMAPWESPPFSVRVRNRWFVGPGKSDGRLAVILASF